MIQNKLRDTLFTVWWQGTYNILRDILTMLETMGNEDIVPLKNLVFDTLNSIIENKEDWMYNEARTDAVWISTKMYEHLEPIIEPLERYTKDSTNLSENIQEAIGLQLHVVFASILAFPTLFSYAYVIEGIREERESDKRYQDIIFERDKYKNEFILLFWGQTIELIAKELILTLNYKNEITKEDPRCMSQLTKILDFNRKSFKQNTIEYADIKTLVLNWGIPVVEAVQRFTRHVRRWGQCKTHVNKDTLTHCLKLLNYIEVAADYYRVLFPRMIAMSFESEE